MAATAVDCKTGKGRAGQVLSPQALLGSSFQYETLSFTLPLIATDLISLD